MQSRHQERSFPQVLPSVRVTSFGTPFEASDAITLTFLPIRVSQFSLVTVSTTSSILAAGKAEQARLTSQTVIRTDSPDVNRSPTNDHVNLEVRGLAHMTSTWRG